MKANQKFRSSHSRIDAFTLIEMLVYMGVMVIVLGIAYAATYRSMDASAALRRNANDISRALGAGERWRADMRNAKSPPQIETLGAETILHMPQPNGEIAYRFTSNSILRRVQPGPWAVILRDVQNSAMLADRRDNVTAWRWELELQTSRKAITRTRPLFTFISVPVKANR